MLMIKNHIKLNEQYSSDAFIEQTKMVYSSQPYVILTTTFVSISICFLLYSTVDSFLLFTWLSLVLCTNMGRILYLLVSRNSQSISYKNKRYQIILYALVSGILWAQLPLLLIYESEPKALIIVVGVLVMMIVGTVAPPLTILSSMIAFSFPVVVALCIALLVLPYVDFLFFGLILFSVIMFIISGRKIEKMVLNSIQIRFENQELVDKLNQQKRVLKEEKDEQKRLKHIAEKASLAKSKFLAAASHDLRQPLHALGLYLDVISDELITDKQKALADKMGSAVDSLKDLFQHLLDISQLDAGNVKPNLINFSSKMIFSRLEDRFKPLVLEKNLDIFFKQQDEVLYTDPILLERILDNLIGNAIRYTDSGSVTVVEYVIDENIVIEVNDTGTGIPIDEQESVFTEFYQLHNPERDRSKGLGLGLSIVRRLCDLLKVKCELKSTVGEGTSFKLLLEKGHDIPRELAYMPVMGHWDLSGTNIMVIDDEVSVCDAMGELLKNWGSNVICVPTISEAVSAIKVGYRPDLLIVDYRLRDGETGLEAITVIDGILDVHVPALLITGDTIPESLQEAERRGFEILHKPIYGGNLRVAVNRILSE